MVFARMGRPDSGRLLPFEQPLGALVAGRVNQRFLKPGGETAHIRPSDRLNNQEVARSGGGDLPEIERRLKFAEHSLRAGPASSAEVDERYVQAA